MAGSSAPAPVVLPAQHLEPSGHWLIRQLRERQVEVDRARLSALLSVHQIPRQRS